jgi:hypothetical protein
LPSPHDAPLFNFDTQVRADEQVALTMQSASAPQLAAHAVPWQRYWPQSSLLLPTHLPHPSQAMPDWTEWLPNALSAHNVVPHAEPFA